MRYGYANNLEEETEKMRYDLYYIKNRSLWLDFRILFRTIAIILLGHGASAVVRESEPRAARSRTWPTVVRQREAREPREARATAGGYMHWLIGSNAARHSAGRQ